MRILVCIKRVPAPGARINITDDAQAVDTAFLGFTMSPHEECAVEEAVQIAARLGGSTTVLTLGPAEAEEQLRYCASIGVQRLLLAPITGPDWDPMRTAAAVHSAIAAVEARDGVFDLILFGNESADSSGFQVGIRVAHALGRPIVNGAKGIEVDAAGTDAAVARVRRPIDGGSEVFALPLPAVVGVKEGINLPRYPTMKGRLDAKKAPLERIDPSAAPGAQQLVALRRPAEKASSTVVLGHGPDAAPAIVDLLAELGVLA